jgi:hypothetical protein
MVATTLNEDGQPVEQANCPHEVVVERVVFNSKLGTVKKTWVCPACDKIFFSEPPADSKKI